MRLVSAAKYAISVQTSRTDSQPIACHFGVASGGGVGGRSGCANGCGSLLVRRAVDALAEQVSVPVVLGILLDHVDDDGAHRHDACSHHDGVVE
jgi:hypothetical protein